MNAAPDVYPLHPDADQKTLRQLGALAHQARAALRAADRFVAQDHGQAMEIAGWLVCTAMDLAHEVAEDIENMARDLSVSSSPAQQLDALAPVRRAAHQLHAACRAADLFLEQDSSQDRDAGTWLIASARTLADRLTAALDDQVSARAWTEPVRRVTAPVSR